MTNNQLRKIQTRFKIQLPIDQTVWSLDVVNWSLFGLLGLFGYWLFFRIISAILIIRNFKVYG